MRNKLRVFSLLAISGAAFIPGCAVQKTKAPQIASSTANALNFATLISQAQADYQDFFRNVGTLEKAGSLNADQVKYLNDVGDKMRDSLDAAGNLAQTYAATKDQGIANQISVFLQQAAQIYAQLYSSRATMLSGNVATKAATAKPQL